MTGWVMASIFGKTARLVRWRMPSNRFHAKKRKNKIEHPAALGAILDLGHCLNLLDSQYVPVIQAGYQALAHWMDELDKPMPQNRPAADGGAALLRDLDCAVINMVHATRREGGLLPFDSVRAAVSVLRTPSSAKRREVNNGWT